MGTIIDGNIPEPAILDGTDGCTQHNTTTGSLSDLIAKLPDQQSEHVRRLAATFGVPDSGTGLLGFAQEFAIDLRIVRSITDLPEWVGKLEALLSAIRGVTSPQVTARDLSNLRSQRKNVLRDFLSAPKVSLSPHQRQTVRAARALVGLRLLSANEHLAPAQSTELARCLQGDTDLLTSPTQLTPARLRELQSSLPADSPRRKLISVLSAALEISLRDPFPITAPESRWQLTSALLPSLDVSGTPPSQHSERVPLAPPSSFREPDILRGRKASISTAGSRVLSGIAGLYDHLAPFELQEIVPHIVQKMWTSHMDEGAAALIALFTTLLPRAYGRLPLNLEGEPGIALDMAAGHLCWNLDQVITGNYESKTSRYVRVPLPIELINELQRRYKTRPAAATLAQLFDADLDALGRRSKKMLRQLSLSSHRPTLTRLSLSWGRYVLSFCQDETYASAIGLDFTLGTTANLNYVRLRGGRMLDIVSHCCKRMGLSGQSGSLPADIGSERLPTLQAAEAFVQQLFGEASEALVHLPRRCTPARLAEIHNVVATRLYAALKMILAERSMSEETTTAVSLDIETGLVELVDKRTAPYHERRVVLLTPYGKDWIKTYFSWLGSLAYRLDTINRPLSRRIAALIHHTALWDVHPLFFRIEPNGSTKPLGSADTAGLFEQHGLYTNAGRHLLDALFRESSLDSAIVMAWAGRGMPGQEAYSSGSTTVPLSVLRTAAAVIEGWLSTMKLPQVPEISPRRLSGSHPEINKKTRYTPKLLQDSPASLRNTNRMERCPFLHGVTRLAAQYSDLLRIWRLSGPPCGLAAVALSLVFEDGVHHGDELHAAVDAIYSASIYTHDYPLFVDCRSDTLGIRRVWLSPTTFRLAGQSRPPDDATERSRVLTSGVATFLATAKVIPTGDPIRYLIQAAQAFSGLRVPGILRAWMDGTKLSRTSRPETIARELLGRCESPTFDATQSPPRRRNRESLFGTLLELANQVPHKKSHRQVVKELHQHLEDIEAEFDPASEQALQVGYCAYLCATQSNVHTIKRYMDACRPFISAVAAILLSEGDSGIDWMKLTAQALEGKLTNSTNTPEATAIHHFLRWQGVNVQIRARIGPPPSTLIYADRLTARECSLSISMLARQRQHLGDDWHRAEVALQLMLDAALRWDEVANLRICDVALKSRTPHIVITQESRAALKSDNAARVIALHLAETVDALLALHALRVARYPDDPLVPLFGDDGESRDAGCAERIHDLVTDALRRASGSSRLHPHSTRHTVITRQVSEILRPQPPEHCRALALRQALPRISAAAGHGHFDATVSHYVQDLDQIRRLWMDHLLADAPPPSVAFISRVTGTSAAALRKRMSRGITSGDIWEGFSPDHFANSGICLTNLASLVDPVLTEIPWASQISDKLRLTAHTIYLGLRLIGEDENTARCASRLAPHESQELERALISIQRCRETPFAASPISRERFLVEVSKAHLAHAIAALQPERTILRTAVSAIQKLGEPLALRSYEDVLGLARLVPPLAAIGIQVSVSIRQSPRSSVDAYLVSRLTGLGLAETKIQSGRYFPRGSGCLLRCVPTAHLNKAPPRASVPLTFHATVALLAVHIAQGQ